MLVRVTLAGSEALGVVESLLLAVELEEAVIEAVSVEVAVRDCVIVVLVLCERDFVAVSYAAGGGKEGGGGSGAELEAETGATG